MGQPLIAPVDNRIEQGKVILDLKQLIDLLLIFNDSKASIGIFGGLLYLRRS